MVHVFQIYTMICLVKEQGVVSLVLLVDNSHTLRKEMSGKITELGGYLSFWKNEDLGF